MRSMVQPLPHRRAVLSAMVTGPGHDLASRFGTKPALALFPP
jgi:hypothetical protein